MINGLGPKKLINLHLQSGQQSKEKPMGKGEIREEKEIKKSGNCIHGHKRINRRQKSHNHRLFSTIQSTYKTPLRVFFLFFLRDNNTQLI